MALIEQEGAIEEIESAMKGDESNVLIAGLACAKGIIASLPSADVVEVVRCKDCRWYERPEAKIFENCCRNNYLIPVKPNDYCSYGKRKGGD